MPPFDDPAVRRAFAQAINRERVATVSLEGRVALAQGIVPPTMPGGPWTGQVLPYDLAAARATLASSRYGGADKLPRATIYGSGSSIGVSMRKVYGRDLEPDSNTLDVLIGRIRRKLGLPLIHTVRGRGFRLGSADALD